MWNRYAANDGNWFNHDIAANPEGFSPILCDLFSDQCFVKIFIFNKIIVNRPEHCLYVQAGIHGVGVTSMVGVSSCIGVGVAGNGASTSISRHETHDGLVVVTTRT